MITVRVAFLASIALLLSALASVAAATDWQITKMSGDVRIFQNNITWVSLKRDRQLRAGDAIWTGHNGRVLLSSPDGRVLLKPRSLVKIPKAAQPDHQTVLFQSMGTIEADIEKRDQQYFSIQSPFLAAVVKGTKFSIEIGNKQTRLSVSEGVVQAVDPQTGQSLDVAAGQTVATLHGVTTGMVGDAPGAAPDPSRSGRSGGESSNNGGSSSGGSGGGGGGGADDKAFPSNGNKGNNGKGNKFGHFK